MLMTMTGVALSAALFLSVLIRVSCSANVDMFTYNDDQIIRDLQGDDFECPDKEETLFYNIDIFIEGIGEGCEAYDLYDIGNMLQRVVDEVEEEIPEYKRREKMETTM
jgi:hypothetical protein